MQEIMTHLRSPFVVTALLCCGACAKPAPDPIPLAIPATVRVGTTLRADPDPIILSDGTGLGETTLIWSTTAAHVEVHVDAVNGPVMGNANSKGKMRTGKWVHNGMKFYLQDSDAPDRSAASATLGVIAIVVSG